MTAVIKLPTELCRLRSADQLVKEWGRIQAAIAGQDKLTDLVAWRADMEKHLVTFITSQREAGG